MAIQVTQKNIRVKKENTANEIRKRIRGSTSRMSGRLRKGCAVDVVYSNEATRKLLK